MIHGIKEDLLNVQQTDDKLLLAIDNSENGDFSNSDIVSILRNEGAIEVQNNTEAFNTSHSEYSASNPPKFQSADQNNNSKNSASSETAKVLSEEERNSRLELIKSTLGEANDTIKNDLKLISGVGPKYEETLNSIGIFTFEQVSKMTPETIQAIEEVTNYFPGRIERDDWIGQAIKLMNN